jgi:hypothetical protein
LDLITSSHVQQIYHVALSFEDSFLITWRDNSGHDHINSQGLPEELTDFLYARNAQHTWIRDVPNIRCTLGPYNSSFFAHDSSAYRWMNLPTDLLLVLQSKIKDGDWIDRPRIVALGANNNFVLVTKKDAAVWNLENYKTIANLLECSDTHHNSISDIHAITLHPYRFSCFIMQSRRGALSCKDLPVHSLPAFLALEAPVMQDTSETKRILLRQRESDQRENMQRRPSNLQQRAQLRREWSESRQQFTAHAKGVKLSLSLSITAGGLARLLG